MKRAVFLRGAVPLAALTTSATLTVAACTFVESRDGLAGPSIDGDAAVGQGEDDGGAQPMTDADVSTDAEETADGSLGDADVHAGPTVMYTNQVGAIGITVRGDDVYWVAGQPRGLLRAPRRGGAPASIVHLDDLQHPVGDAFDLAVDGTYVTWTTKTGAVFRRLLTGGANESCFTVTPSGAYIALGAAGIYVTDFRLDGTGLGAVNVGTCGGGVRSAFGNQPRASGIAIPDAGSLVYWGRNAPDALAYSGFDDAGTASTLHGVVGAVSGVAADDRAIYWIREDRKILTFSFSTRAEEEIYDRGAPFGGGDIAVDDEAIYWTEGDPGVVMRMPKP